MAGFSQVTLTGNFGSIAIGSLTFLLQQPMANAGVTATVIPLIVALASGAFSSVFNANGDALTMPNGVWYNVTEEIIGSPVADYAIFIPGIQTETNGSTTLNSTIVQLSTVSATKDMIGGSITGAGIPSGTIVVDAVLPVPINEIQNYPFESNTNTLTISNPATTTATGLSLVIGETVDISYLRPTNLPWT